MVCVCASVTQSCSTLCDPMDWSPPGSSVYGILQARILEWAAISFSSHYVLLFTNVNSSWGPGALQSPRTKKSQRIVHDQDIGPSPKMLQSSTGMSDAGGKRSRQDYSGAVSGDLRWAGASELESRRLQGAIWGSLGPSAGGKGGRLEVHTDRDMEWERRRTVRGPGPLLGGEVVFGQVSSQAALRRVSHRERRLVWLHPQTHCHTCTFLSLITAHVAKRAAALFSAPQVKCQPGSNRDQPSSPVGGREFGRVFTE